MGTLLWQEFVESGLPNELGELGRTGSSWRWAVYPWQVFIHPLGWTASVVQALVIANTLFQQRKRRLYTWTSPDGQYPNQIDYIHCSQRWRSSIQSSKTGPGADCGSDHELVIGKFRLKLKKVGKTTREGNGIPLQYSCHLLISSASVRSIPFLSFIVSIFA